MFSYFSHIWLFATLWTVACQAPLSMGFSRQEYWTGLPFPSPEDPPNPGIEPSSPVFQADSLLTELKWKPLSASVRSIQFLSLLYPSLQEMIPWYLKFSWRELYSIPLYCFPLYLCTDHWGRLYYLSLLFFGTLHSNGCIFPFSPLPSVSLLFSAICKASSDNHFAYFHLFFLGMVLITPSCTMYTTREPPSLVLQALYQI